MINFFFLNHLSDFGKDFDKNIVCSIRESRFSRVILQISVKLCPTSAAAIPVAYKLHLWNPAGIKKILFFFQHWHNKIQMRFSFLLTCSVVPILSKSGYFGFFQFLNWRFLDFFSFWNDKILKRWKLANRHSTRSFVDTLNRL